MNIRARSCPNVNNLEPNTPHIIQPKCRKFLLQLGSWKQEGSIVCSLIIFFAILN